MSGRDGRAAGVALAMGGALLAALWAAGPRARGQEPGAAGVVFDAAFWERWSDGQAEVLAYDLSFRRYGVERRGVAVSIFVKEPMSEALRVKADPGRHAAGDVFEVMKLNLVRDFPTGVYDYNVMTSTFVGLQPSGGRPAGSVAKVSFSAQEWCGHVYHQALFDRDGVREESHSYFDGEADARRALESPPAGLAEDALWHWARGFAAPRLAPGETRRAALFGSLLHARLGHTRTRWREATLTREAAPREVAVPAGRFEVETLRVDVGGERAWTFEVERAAPRRIVRWECSSGETGVLISPGERMPYWSLNGPEGARRLEALGLSPRAPRTP